jgi:Outer membrane protein beta-barrel domain
MRKLLALGLALAFPFLSSAQDVPSPPRAYPPPPAYPPNEAGWSQPAYQQPRALEKQRDSWYIGFGLGGGSGSAAGQDERLSFEDLSIDSPTTGFFNFRVGATLTPRLLLGGELSGIAAVASDGDFSSTVSISNADLVATYFPTGRGLSLRGGIGRSTFSTSLEGGGFDDSYEESGFNAMGGVGYAWWLGRTFNLSVNLDFYQQWYGASEVDVESSRFGVLYLGFDWY